MLNLNIPLLYLLFSFSLFLSAFPEDQNESNIKYGDNLQISV